MNTALAVFLGGGLGASLRYGTGLLSLRWWGASHFPWTTLGINVLGSLLIGVLAAALEQRLQLSMPWRSFFVTGVLGGFTTFSAFSLETLLLIERGAWSAALAYMLASVVLAVLACAAGFALAR